MGALDAAWRRVAAGGTATIKPRGRSMTGVVPDGATVVVQPCRPEVLETDDVVLVRVAGRVYLHKVLIGNNRGRVNGWTGFDKVVGIATSVNATPRPRLGGKVLE